MHDYRRIAALDAKDVLHNVACAACEEDVATVLTRLLTDKNHSVHKRLLMMMEIGKG
jgi:hypothetical protein